MDNLLTVSWRQHCLGDAVDVLSPCLLTSHPRSVSFDVASSLVLMPCRDGLELLLTALPEVSLADEPYAASLGLAGGDALPAAALPSSPKVHVHGTTVPLYSEHPDDGLLEDDDSVLAVEFLPELDAGFVASTHGRLLTVDVFGEEHRVECVGAFPCGLLHAAWSPDHDLCALVTRDGNVVLMTSEWDPLYEEALPSLTFAPHEARVQWHPEGRFFSCIVRGAAGVGGPVVFTFDRDCQPLSRSQEIPSSIDDADGALPLVLAWPHPGTLMATVQRRVIGESTSHRVVFFERNGLEKESFELRRPDDTVLGLAWNSDGTLLAITLRTADGEYEVQILRRVCYRWFVKRQIACPSTTPPHALWHPEDPMRFFIICTNGHHNIAKDITFCLDVDVSPTSERTVAFVDGPAVGLTPVAVYGRPPPGFLASIGCPGPVSCLSFDGEGRLAALCAKPSGLALFDSVKTCLPRSRSPPALRGFVALPVDVADAVALPSLRHLESVDEHTFLVVATDDAGAHDELYQLSVSHSEEGALALDDLLHLRIPDGLSVIRLCRVHGSRQVAVHLNDGSVAMVRLGSGPASRPIQLRPHPVSLPSPCPWFGLVSMGGRLVVVGRSRRMELYLNDTLLSPQCLSVTARVPHSRYLTFVAGGRQHAVFFLDRQRSLDDNVAPENRTDPHMVRYSERAQTIITVVDDGAKQRLLMWHPRGNFETIRPRILSLLATNKLLACRDFVGAFELAQRHGLDLNLLYDHDPAAFAACAADFLRASSDKLLRVELFLQRLRDEDVTKTEYPGYVPLPFAVEEEEEEEERATPPAMVDDSDPELSDGVDEEERLELERDAVLQGLGSHADGASVKSKHRREAKARHLAANKRRLENLEAAAKALANQEAAEEQAPPPREEGKTNFVCNLMLDAIRARPDAGALNSLMVVAMCKQKPPALEDAIALIAASHARERGSERALVLKAVALANKFDVYNAALATYDAELAQLVARHAEMDPVEYQPFLRKLAAKQLASEHERRYEIAMHLERYERALEHACDAGSEFFDRVLRLVKEQELFDLALKRFSVRRGEEWTALMRLYGNHLDNSSRLLDAAHVFSACLDNERALELYSKAGAWEHAFLMASRLEYDAEQKRELAYELARTLRSSFSRHEDAAFLLANYCDDTEEAVTVLVRASRWLPALRTAAMASREDLIETEVLPRLGHGADRLVAKLKKMRAEYEYCSRRLRVVRANKLLNPGDHHVAATLGDDAASMVSGVSNFSALTMNSDLSGVSTLSSMSTSSSIFSVEVPEEMSREELKRLRARRKKMSKRKGKGIVKEGDAREEESIVRRMRASTPSARMRERVSSLVQALLFASLHDKAATVQAVFEAFLDVVAAEERKPMPQATPEMHPVLQALAASWRWPAEMYAQDPVPLRASTEDRSQWRLQFLAAASGEAEEEEAGGGGEDEEVGDEDEESSDDGASGLAGLF